jgi:SAM-dependent methyltransferase
MHLAARLFIRQFATREPDAVLEVGSRNVNGGIRDLFPNAAYTGVDITEGDGVDVVADAATWEPDREYDIVICAEVLEHAPAWRDIVKTCWRALRPGGVFVMTAAGPGRKPHSAYEDADPVGEWYENIEPAFLEEATAMFFDANIDVAGDDIRMWAIK